MHEAKRVSTSFRLRPGTVEGLGLLSEAIQASQAEVIERMVRHACRARGLVLSDELPEPSLAPLSPITPAHTQVDDAAHARIAQFEIALEGLHGVIAAHSRRLARHLDGRDREAIARASSLVEATQVEGDDRHPHSAGAVQVPGQLPLMPGD